MSANAYARIAERHLGSTSDHEAVERFFLDVAPTLSREEREAIVAELLADEANGTSASAATEIPLEVPTYSIDEAPPVSPPNPLAQLVGELSAAIEKRVGDRVDAAVTRAMDQLQEATGRADSYHRGASSLEPIPEEFLSNDFWEKNYKRFLLFAQQRLNNLRFVAGADASDYVIQAAQLILNGARRCPADVDPAHCLIGVIHSLISHDYDSYENRLERDSITAIPDEKSIGIDESLVSDLVVPEIESMVAAREFADLFLRSMPEKYRHCVELRIAIPQRNTQRR